MGAYGPECTLLAVLPRRNEVSSQASTVKPSWISSNVTHPHLMPRSLKNLSISVHMKVFPLPGGPQIKHRHLQGKREEEEQWKDGGEEVCID